MSYLNLLDSGIIYCPKIEPTPGSGKTGRNEQLRESAMSARQRVKKSGTSFQIWRAPGIPLKHPSKRKSQLSWLQKTIRLFSDVTRPALRVLPPPLRSHL
jgi:hypothetical protein